MPNPIPAFRRTQVADRDQRRCIRCGAPGRAWHHRRGKRVRDTHTHCSCNGVTLCTTCHAWVHANPLLAMPAGLIVSRYIRQPGTIPVVVHGQPWMLDCEGDGTPAWNLW